MKLLKLSSKGADQFWDISAPTLEDTAYKELFKSQDADGCYIDLEDDLANLVSERKDITSLRQQLTTFSFTSEVFKETLDRWIRDRECRCKEYEIAQLERQVMSYRQAKTGSVKAMKELIHLRSDMDYEYEQVSVVKL